LNKREQEVMMNSRRMLHKAMIGGVLAATMVGAAAAQTLATGDSRTVVEPTIPPVCTTLSSQQAIAAGGPASETLTDTARIQAALTACASGKVVELAASGTNYAFLSGALTVPTGVGLLVDGGVTLFGSRNPGDYQTSSTEQCGTYGPLANGCNALITFVKNGTGQGIYGYGVIDGRGGSTMLSGPNPGESWWTNADKADGNGGQDNPILVDGSTSNLTLYKITLRNSPMFHVAWTGTGLTIWGVKIQAPYTAHNTDGIDPTGSNITINNASISDGDDNIAVGASSPSSNVTINNTTTYSGHGLSVGSYTSGGLTNYLAENVNMAGTAADSNGTGIRLKSAVDRGGTLNNLTYENFCIRDTHYPLQFNPFYDTNTGTSYPLYENIVLDNVHVLTPTGTNTYSVQLQGYDANHLTTVTFDNLVFDSLVAADITPAPQDITITLEGNVYPSFLQTLTGSGVSYNGKATAVAGAGVSACTNAFPYIVGELYMTSGTTTNLKTATIADTGSITLDAMLQPSMATSTYAGTSGTYTGAAAPTAAVNFYDGAKLAGTGTIGQNGTVASLTINQPTAGTHTYTAAYPGDSTYAALTFGSVTLTVNGPAVASVTTVAPPATVVYGAADSLTATVTGTGGTPTGTVAFYAGSTSLGSATLSNGTATLSPVPVLLPGGTNSITAIYSGDLIFMTSTSASVTQTVTPATPTTTGSANPTTVTVLNTSVLSATVKGISGGAVPTGQVVFSDGTTTLGTGTLTAGATTVTATLPFIGPRTLQACYSGDTNYATACGPITITVTPITASLGLTLAPSTVYVGGSIVMTATVSPADAGVTVSFYNGTVVAGTGTTNALGVATYTLTAQTTVGTQSLSASVPASGNYSIATSATKTLNVVAPVGLNTQTATIYVTHGTSGNVTFNVQPGGGYVGAVNLSCVTSAPYLTCSPSSQVVGVAGQSATIVTSTINVNLTTASLDRSGTARGIAWAMLLPLGLLGLVGTRRRVLRISAVVMLLAGITLGGLAGCSGNPAAPAPTGSQTVTYTEQSDGLTSTLVVTVVIE
jgi:polygalacturonase